MRKLKIAMLLIINLLYIKPAYAWNYDVDMDLNVKEVTDYIHSVSYNDTIFILIEDGNKFIDTDEYSKFYKNIYQIYVSPHSPSRRKDGVCILCLERINEYIDSKLNNNDVIDKDLLGELYDIKYNNIATLDKIEDSMVRNSKIATNTGIVLIIFLLIGFPSAFFITSKLFDKTSL